VPNQHLVQSAIARPYSGYYRSIASKAAALVQSVSRNHGFADGNKRTALILLHTFLTRSGYRLAALPNENLKDAAEKMVLDVVNSELNFNQLVAWLEARIIRKP
jgi:death on curing protein